MLRRNKAAAKALAVIFWLIVWQAAAVITGRSIILPSPIETAARLAELITDEDFFRIILNSTLQIALGFMLGMVSGIVLAAFSERYEYVKVMLSPLITAVKSVPVASFIILALFWLKSSSLSLLISFLIVLPVIYESVCKGISSADKKLLEAAKVYGFSAAKKIRYIYIPAAMPSFMGALSAASGLAFKSGTAAEVIGRADYTLGEMLYASKIYLETADLFAWTIVIIILSRLFETAAVKITCILFRGSQKVNQ